jgi:phytoene desaturase
VKKKVAIVGAGPGGLTAGMILASHGYQVDLYEKEPRVGGRNGCLEQDGYRFDIGPTFLMMKFILEEMFQIAGGRNVDDYLDIRSLDPLYRLVFSEERQFLPTQDKAKLKEQVDRLYPGDWDGYLRFLEYETKKFDKITPCLQVPYTRPSAYFTPRFLKALPYMDAHFSLYKHLAKYFKHDELRLAFTFQAKYLGMSPWKCPATFSIISFIEHTGGVHHPIGGLNRISHAMAKVIDEEGGSIHLSTPVKEVIVRGGKAVGLELADGSEISADYVVLNSDFGHAMNHLIDVKHLKKWTPSKLKKKEISCSGFLLYLGIDRVYEDVPHHSVIFAEDYKRNVEEIADSLELSEQPSIYVQNASVTDPTLAPEGKSTVYVLVPIANNRSGIDWPEQQARYREKVLDILEQRAGFPGIRQHIEFEKIITPRGWEDDYAVYDGAVFNLAHNLEQMLWLRPHNQFEEFDNCYLVGGGTHPGSGLPTIYESGRISAGMIIKRDAWWA